MLKFLAILLLFSFGCAEKVGSIKVFSDGIYGVTETDKYLIARDLKSSDYVSKGEDYYVGILDTWSIYGKGKFNAHMKGIYFNLTEVGHDTVYGYGYFIANTGDMFFHTIEIGSILDYKRAKKYHVPEHLIAHLRFQI